MEAKSRYVEGEGLPLATRVYFAPCHQREQNTGRPYLDLLALIPDLAVEPVGDSDCCGMGGNFGFKAGFHETSLDLGRPLMEKIRNLAPQAIVTDCMSCRLQFSHALPYPVFPSDGNPGQGPAGRGGGLRGRETKAYGRAAILH
jgi:Fe-S oxidoreductase